MKNLLLLSFIVLFTSLNSASAQELRDVLYLKNGNIIKGRIIEQTPNVNLKIQTVGGNTFVYSFDEIEKIGTEESQNTSQNQSGGTSKPLNLPDPPDMSEYKYQLGLGVSVLGGGIGGVPIRIGLNRKFIFELGVTLRPIYFQKTETYYYNGQEYSSSSEDKFIIPPMISAGFDVYFNETYHSGADKIIRNGMTFKVGKTISTDIGETMVAVGWARERFHGRNKKNSYIMNLGAGILSYDDTYDWYGADLDLKILPMIYLKFAWNWGLF